MKALVIDDNQSVRMFVERVLREAGYDTATAKDGVAAQQHILKDGAPDLVVTDESMPRMSGQELARWIRESFPAVKVLFLTGHIDHVARNRDDAWEREGYLEKPCTVRGLLQAVSLLMFRRLEAPAISRPSPAP